MQTLSYGWKKPQTGDKGDTFFPALEDNIQKSNDHTHDGSNSAKIDTSNLNKTTVSVTNSGWTASGDLYRKSVTFPGTYTQANSMYRIKADGGTYDGEDISAKTEYIDNTHFYLYSPVNNQAFKVLFI